MTKWSIASRPMVQNICRHVLPHFHGCPPEQSQEVVTCDHCGRTLHEHTGAGDCPEVAQTSEPPCELCWRIPKNEIPHHCVWQSFREMQLLLNEWMSYRVLRDAPRKFKPKVQAALDFANKVREP